MRKRSKIVFAVIALALLGMLAWKILSPQEPVYQGKPLSVWLRVYDSGIIQPEWKETDQAVRQMGTNAIPALLDLLQAREHSPALIKLIRFAQKQHIFEVNYPTAADKHFRAGMAFVALGPDAQAAVPQLIKIDERKLSVTSQAQAIAALGSIGPSARQAVPLLLRDKTSTNLMVRVHAIESLGRIHAEPELVVPALIESLNDIRHEPNYPSYSAQGYAVNALEEFGTNAKPAVPALIALINSQANIIVKDEAANALKAIDPETGAKAEEMLIKSVFSH